MIKVFIFFLSLCFSSPLFSHWDSAYFRNANDGFSDKKNWMSEVQDDIFLSEIALPGTHDSAAYKRKYIDSVTTQVLNFNQQLEYGIRVFDIRIRHTSDRFALHHGPVFLDVMFGDFLNAVDQFLIKNPSEVVLFRLKEEYKTNNNNTRSLRDTLDYYLSLHSQRFFKTTNKNIRLGDVRGKFIILSNVSEFNSYGLSYSSFTIQDNYNLITNWDLYKKWESIKTHLQTAREGSKNTFYVNYLSGFGGSFPYFVASGHFTSGTSAPRLATGLTTPIWAGSYPDFPRVACFIGICTIAFEGTNILTRDMINNYNSTCDSSRKLNSVSSARTVGIIMADFPGESLINSIINNNRVNRF